LDASFKWPLQASSPAENKIKQIEIENAKDEYDEKCAFLLEWRALIMQYSTFLWSRFLSLPSSQGALRRRLLSNAATSGQ